MDGRNNAEGGARIMDKVKDGAVSQLSTQKDRATDGIGSVAQAVRQSTQQLREQQHDTIAQYVEQAADQIDRFTQRLREKDVRELVSDAQRLARRQPAVFIGSAFALGLVAARFLKSSARSDEADYGGTSWGSVEYERNAGGGYGGAVRTTAHDRTSAAGRTAAESTSDEPQTSKAGRPASSKTRGQANDAGRS
jgi:vacuolar-type H+-ATPase subunit E/Vma4